MNLLILPGDGIGPEIMDATLAVLRHADAAFRLGLTFRSHDIGLATLQTHGTTLPPHVIEAVTQADGVVLGPVSHLDYPPAAEGGINPSG
ncbi:MAG: isocitrate/isopropylmalate family dehydrogenase, partial [Acetobacteraceae bacterium]